MRIIGIVVRIIRQFIRDKRTLGLMIVAPIFVLFLMSLVFNGNEYEPNIAVNNISSTFISQLKNNGATIIKTSVDEANIKLENKEIDAFIKMEGINLNITLEGSDPTANKSVLIAVQKLTLPSNENLKSITPNINYLYGSKDMNLFDNFGPILIGFFIFFFVFLIAGISFLRERTTGTLERLLATPLRRWEIVIGYVIGFGIFTTFQSIIISWFSVKILGIMLVGSFLYVLLITFLLTMSALTLGTLLSTFANNELQIMQFIPIIIIPQLFFSGLFNLDTMSNFLKSMSKIMPLTYGSNALHEIMIRGKGWSTISSDVYVLLGFSVFFTILNIFALKRYRKL